MDSTLRIQATPQKLTPNRANLNTIFHWGVTIGKGLQYPNLSHDIPIQVGIIPLNFVGSITIAIDGSIPAELVMIWWSIIIAPNYS
jgi:hypothetical protein